MQLGLYNELQVKEINETGVWLSDSSNVLVQLPSKEVSKEYKPGDNVNVFLYKNNKDEVTATLQKPLITLYDYAVLEVKQTNTSGAFLNWGLEKDLFLPYPEQEVKVKRGEKVFVFLTLEPQNDRLFASSKVEQFIPDVSEEPLERKQEVDLIVWRETDLGYKVIVNKDYQGLVYHDEVFKPLEEGDRLKGYIKAIREDGKIDVSLQPIGVQAIDAHAQAVLNELNASGGRLDLHDKSAPEEIEAILKMSKKAFKRAIGNLYRQRIIELVDGGIRLVKD